MRSKLGRSLSARRAPRRSRIKWASLLKTLVGGAHEVGRTCLLSRISFGMPPRRGARRAPPTSASQMSPCHDCIAIPTFNGRVSLIMLVGGTHEAYYHKKLFNSNPNKFIILALCLYIKEGHICRKYLIF